MAKKKKKESLREKRRRLAMRQQQRVEAERLRRAREPGRNRKWPRSRVLGISFLAIVALAIGAYIAWPGTQPPSESDGLPTLYTLTDAEFSEFRGKVIVVDCFATWCEPCKTEIPHLAELRKSYGSGEVAIVSVGSASDTETKLSEFKKEFNMDWYVARDSVAVFDKYNIAAIPTLIILDQDGNIHFTREGVTDAATLSETIDGLLAP
jgi:thiol-disulfide isomerase/thioredoxin